MLDSKKGIPDHPSYIKKLEEDPTGFPDESLLENLNQSYAALQQREYKDRAEYLFHRGMMQKKARDIIHKKSQEKRERDEFKECTFSPNITPADPKYSKIR